MLIYTFYVRLLIKKLPSFSIDQLNNFSIVSIYLSISTQTLAGILNEKISITQ